MMQPTLLDLERLAHQAGVILRLGYERDHEVNYKGVIDLVTEVDHQSEAFLLSEIQRTFSGHRIVSEEIGVVPGRDEDLWFVDPIDGTVNYAHGVPFFSVSIAYVHAGILSLGVVYDPMRDELFAAEVGKGATRNGHPIHTSGADELQKSLLVTGFPYDSWSAPRNNLEYFGRFTRLSQGVRRLGSAALDLCYVAAGRLDGYWELTLKQWDVAGGGLIASEAGATVTSLDGDPDYLTPPCSILAAAPGIHGKMLHILKQ